MTPGWRESESLQMPDDPILQPSTRKGRAKMKHGRPKAQSEEKR